MNEDLDAKFDAIRAKADKDATRHAIFAFFVGGPVLAIAFWIVPSYFEARAYSRLTGTNVSTWDALWVDLRVQESPQREGP